MANSAASVLACNCSLRSVSVLVLAPRFSMTNLLSVRIGSLSSRPFFVKSGERRAGEALEFLEVLEILLLDGDIILEPLGVGLRAS